MDFWLEIQKTNVKKFQKTSQHPRDTMGANLYTKQTTLTFWAQICPKRYLGFEIQKTNVGIRISVLEKTYVPIFRQNRKL